MKAILRSALFLLVWLLSSPLLLAQPAPFRDELLPLLPDDFAVCVTMRDLRGQVQRWKNSEWFERFQQSPLGKTFLEAPELKQLAQWEKDLQKHFDLDWAVLRDDILGDNVLFAFAPGPMNKPEEERGLFLIQARKPERIAKFIGRLNELQQKSGEVKSLTPLKHQGITYYRRVESKKTQFYFLEGSLFALSTREEWVRAVLDRKVQTGKESPWVNRFRRAGADQGFVTLGINPRTAEPDFVKSGKKDEGFPGYWQALDAIFITLNMREEAEVRIAIQANPAQLPQWTRGAFTATAVPSTLWQRFPEQSIVTLAAKTDFAGTMDALKTLLPEKDRKKLPTEFLQNILPNIGPDWGMCVLPAKDAQHLPQTLFAVALKPGTKEQPIDQALHKMALGFARLPVDAFNSAQPKDPISIQTVKQGDVEVTYLSHAKLFPPGMQPACALKEGFLLFASSPEAILSFRLHTSSSDSGKDTLLLRLSTQELAKLLRQRQGQIIPNLKLRHQFSDKEARQNLESAISLMELFEHVTLRQHAEGGQASWRIQLSPSVRRESPK